MFLLIREKSCFYSLGRSIFREKSKRKMKVSKRKDYGERRVIRLEGAERKVAFSEAMGQNEEETSRKSAPKSLNSEGFALSSE